MKKLALILPIWLLMTATGYTATIVLDPVLFYSIYHNPKTVIDFFKLKDGISFDNIPDTYRPKTRYLDNPKNLIVYTGERNDRGGFSFIAVRSQAFSDNWSFKGVHPAKPKIFREHVIWFDQGITTGSFEIVISTTSHHSKPFAIYTEKGFIGIIPNSPQETRFILEDIHIISSFETGFSMLDAIPRLPDDPHFFRKLNPHWI